MRKAYIGVYIVLLVIHIVLAMVLPTDPRILARYHLSSTGAALLSGSVVLPIVIIYLIALYGFVRVSDYAVKVRSSKEGHFFNLLAAGLTVWSFGLPIRSIVASLANYVKHAHPVYFPALNVMREYLTLAFSFTALLLISRGAYGLYRTLKQRPPAARWDELVGLSVAIVVASVYTWLVVTQAAASPDLSTIPVWLIILTLTIPYVFAWCIGGWAVVHIYRYHMGIRGVIYKKALSLLAAGLAVIIFDSMAVQFLSSLSGLINRLDLSPILIILYGFVAIYAVGYILVARGAHKLQLIEEA